MALLRTPPLFLTLSLLCILSLLFFYLYSTSTSTSAPPPPPISKSAAQSRIKVHISPLPRSLNYGLLHKYWALTSDSRIGSQIDNQIRKQISRNQPDNSLPYPENPIIKQYSAEYWILGDLLTPQEMKGDSFAERVSGYEEADVIFVPFFATLSAELQLIVDKGVFRKRVEENGDFVRQRMVIDSVKENEAWRKSGGRDHVFVITGFKT